MKTEVAGITRANEGIQGISWNILGQQATENIKAGRVGDCIHGIHAALNLRITPREIDGDPVRLAHA